MATAIIMTDTQEVLERQCKIRDLIAEGKLNEAIYLVAYDAKYIIWLLYERTLAEEAERALNKTTKSNKEEILHEKGQSVLPDVAERR